MAQKLERTGHQYGDQRGGGRGMGGGAGQSQGGPGMRGPPERANPAAAPRMRQKQEHHQKNQLEAELYKEKLRRVEAEKRMKRLEEQLKNQNQAQMQQPKNPLGGMPKTA